MNKARLGGDGWTLQRRRRSSQQQKAKERCKAEHRHVGDDRRDLRQAEDGTGIMMRSKPRTATRSAITPRRAARVWALEGTGPRTSETHIRYEMYSQCAEWEGGRIRVGCGGVCSCKLADVSDDKNRSSADAIRRPQPFSNRSGPGRDMDDDERWLSKRRLSSHQSHGP